MLACGMRAQHASDTTAPACMRYYHTHLPSIECPARPQLLGHQVGEADDETSRQRGVWDVPANYVKVAFRRDFPGANTATAAMGTGSWPRADVRGLANQVVVNY